MSEQSKNLDEIFCPSCGSAIKKDAIMCVKCGVELRGNKQSDAHTSDKSCTVTFLLCTFFGLIGIHRFYVGKVGSGIAQVLTGGGLGIWTLIDWIVIMTGNFTDNTSRKITW